MKTRWGKLRHRIEYSTISDGQLGWFCDIWDNKKRYYGKPITRLDTTSGHGLYAILTDNRKTLIVEILPLTLKERNLCNG